jgi:hypothetical protein
MFFAYFDESGDTGLERSPTGTFALSCILLHDADWLSALDQTIAFRRYLRDSFHISPRAELKASWLIHNKGDIRPAGLRYPARLAAYRAALRFQRKCGLFRSFTVLIDKTKIQKRDLDVRDTAWQWAIQRLERFGTDRKDNIHVLRMKGMVSSFVRKFAPCAASATCLPHLAAPRWTGRRRTSWRILRIVGRTSPTSSSLPI